MRQLSNRFDVNVSVKTIAAPWECFNVRPAILAFAQATPEEKDIFGQATFLNEAIRPDAGKKRFLIEQPASIFHHEEEQLKTFRREPDGSAVTCQEPISTRDPKWAEFINRFGLLCHMGRKNSVRKKIEIGQDSDVYRATLYVLESRPRAVETECAAMEDVRYTKKGDTPMKRSLLGFIVFALFGGAAYGEQCSNAILNGTYSLYANGTVIGVGPVGLVAVLKYDGRST